MKNRWAMLLAVLLIPVWATAQNAANSSFQIKGILLDSLTKEGEPYATIKIVKKEAPEHALKMLVTDMKGHFQEKVPGNKGNFIMTISSVGRNSIVKNFSVKPGEKSVDFGTMYITDASNELGQVEIVAQKPLVKADIDKIEYNVQDDPDSKSNSVLEMLRKVPLVTVDGEDNIKVNGSSSFKVYVNGKPNNMMSNNPTEVLKSMPANSIKHIEVITNPSAKYDAEGVGGILNIVTVGGGLEGYTATFSGNVSNRGAGGGVFGTIKSGKLTFSARYNYNYNNQPRSYSGGNRRTVGETDSSSSTKLATKTMPTQMIKTDRVTVEHSGAVDATGSGLAVNKRRANITLKQRAAQDRAYIESCFGRCFYPPEQLRKTEQELCTGVHLGCHLWFSAGVPSPAQAPTPEARQLAQQAELQAERNRAYYAKNQELHRSVVLRLTEQIRNCILVHQQPNQRVARSGNLCAGRVWRAPYLNDNRVFLCPEEENCPAFTVDLLLDASASRLHCQEVIAAQGVILAESLANCGIPVRVSAFSSLRGYTVLRVLKGFADKNRQNIFRYFASGWNRDGLALRAAGDLIQYAPGPAPRHLMILLTDASPNDSRRIPPTAENPLGCAYEDAAGVTDTAAQVRTLQRQGVRVSAVFMGEDSSAGAAAQIYGKNMARIRGMDQLARAAGRLIQNEIRELGD